MFRRSNKIIEKRIAEKLINIIGVNTRIDGSITARGNVRIDGIVVGKLNSAARLVIGLTGFIDGIINCKNADIHGTVKGIINSSNLIRLKESAKVEGLINCKRIILDSNAIVKTGHDFNKNYFETTNTPKPIDDKQEERNKLKVLSNFKSKKEKQIKIINKQKAAESFENFDLKVEYGYAK